jgi:hypothetical protein
MSLAVIEERASEGATKWLHFERPRPALAVLDPTELLSRTARLAGNFRYGTAGGDRVVFLGEVRGAAFGSGVDVAAGLEERSHPGADEGAANAGLTEVIEGALDATGLGWKRRDEGWVVPASGRLPREVLVSPEGGGVRVQAVLVEWDEIGTDERAAIGRLLCRAQLGLRFARCELSATQARVTALVESRHVEGALADSVGGVAAGCRLLAREAGALLAADVARAFLAFQGAFGEKGAPVQP